MIYRCTAGCKEYWKSFTSYPLKSCRSIEESWLKIDDGWEERGGSLDFLSSAKWKNTRWTTRWKLMETRSSAWNCLINEYFRMEPARARVAICARKSSCSFIRLVNFARDGPRTKRNNCWKRFRFKIWTMRRDTIVCKSWKTC